MEKITADLVEELVGSRAIDAALVRYNDDDRLEVRSTVPTQVSDLDDYEVVISRIDLPLIDDDGMDFDNLTRDDLEALAEQLNVGEHNEDEIGGV